MCARTRARVYVKERERERRERERERESVSGDIMYVRVCARACGYNYVYAPRVCAHTRTKYSTQASRSIIWNPRQAQTCGNAEQQVEIAMSPLYITPPGIAMMNGTAEVEKSVF